LSSTFNWAGDTIIRDTVMWDKRAVLGYQNIYIPTDIRQWISPSDSEVMERTLQEIGLPSSRGAGTFDQRAWRIWKYVAESVEYVVDKKSCGMEDFWLFPDETLMLHKGDCEDSSFLLASLMLASGISEQCVRVVLGKVISRDGEFGHAWVVYQNEEGTWCLLESTLSQVPEGMPPADPLTQPGVKDQYHPLFCLNKSHLWWISPGQVPLARYVQSREIKAAPRA
jgi:transglutaminase-like putative cysteine protease